jgi:hypothetical protein
MTFFVNEDGREISHGPGWIEKDLDFTPGIPSESYGLLGVSDQARFGRLFC